MKFIQQVIILSSLSAAYISNPLTTADNQLVKRDCPNTDISCVRGHRFISYVSAGQCWNWWNFKCDVCDLASVGAACNDENPDCEGECFTVGPCNCGFMFSGTKCRPEGVMGAC
ncbi:hypothetical protein HDU92_002112 [Lobulomyces angularis]|nr:hypothetical protein HDU92_002112 [Lobulomyces angularis]